MKALMLATITAATVVLSGCGEPQMVWVHPDKENHNFLQDRETCQRRVDSMDANYKAIFDRCMTNLGWEQQQID